MIGIKSIATWLPEERIDLIARAAEFDTNESFIRNKSGFVSVRRMAEDMDTLDLCENAFAALKTKTGHTFDDVDCVILCTQNPDGAGLPHGSALLQTRLGLPRGLAAFDISLGCSGYVYGLSIMKSFMEASGFRSGLLFTADPYSKIISPKDKSTQILFGDGAAVTWIGIEPVIEIGMAKFGTDGAQSGALKVSQTTGTLEMNGRSVFGFSATVIPPFIEQFLKDASIKQDDLDEIVLHQGSKFIVDEIRRRLRADKEKVRFYAVETGNLVSSSIPFILEQKAGQYTKPVLACGFGVGLSWAGILLNPVMEV
jgi:3-oxoacyl-[acyl-carrier-protein] synthase-3